MENSLREKFPEIGKIRHLLHYSSPYRTPRETPIQTKERLSVGNSVLYDLSKHGTLKKGRPCRKVTNYAVYRELVREGRAVQGGSNCRSGALASGPVSLPTGRRWASRSHGGAFWRSSGGPYQMAGGLVAACRIRLAGRYPVDLSVDRVTSATPKKREGRRGLSSLLCHKNDT